MHKIAVIGDKDSIFAFLALGLSVFPVNSSLEARNILKTLVKENYGIIYITEDFAKEIMDLIDEYKDALVPAIILIPSNKGSLGIGIGGIKKSVERAVGADILFKD